MGDDYRSGVVDKYYKEAVAEREERREGYWKRHPDVYQLFKQRHIDTIKRYKKKMQEKKRNSQIGNSQQHKPRLSQTNSSNHSGSKRSSKRMSSKNIHGSSKNINFGSSKNIHSSNQ